MKIHRKFKQFQFVPELLLDYSIFICYNVLRDIEVWLRLVERCVRDAEAVGSSPATSIKKKDHR